MLTEETAQSNRARDGQCSACKKTRFVDHLELITIFPTVYVWAKGRATKRARAITVCRGCLEKVLESPMVKLAPTPFRALLDSLTDCYNALKEGSTEARRA